MKTGRFAAPFFFICALSLCHNVKALLVAMNENVFKRYVLASTRNHFCHSYQLTVDNWLIN